MNGNLREAIEKAIIIPEQQEFESVVPSEHTFSDKFVKRSVALIKRQKRSYYPLICTSARRVACIIAAFFIVSMTTVLSVDALRKPFFDFIVSIFTDHSEVDMNSSDMTSAPDKIEDKYEITSGLEGYTVSYISETDNMRIIVYEDKKNTIRFRQYTMNFGTANVNTEDAETEHIDINGIDSLIWTDNTGSSHIMWTNGEYVFNIEANDSQIALIEIAKSVQKVE
ncbi:MAG: DUF4367 domain-containing protein [Ruminococcus sp.]|nr:DUF4367 domain-containing protein [Ruminococcus sp.]